ncbi:hypothetical protein ACGC1H_003135 [Rhizoctonia solani]
MELTRAPHINSLPVEILTRIFVVACSVHLYTWSAPGIMPRPMFTNNAVTQSHVCYHWRRIAISSSNLWTQIYLDPHQFQDGQVPPRIKTYLDRASGQPLDVHAINPFPRFRATTAAQHGFIQFLTSISPRTWRMVVDVPNGLRAMYLFQRTISTVLKSCAPGTLRELSIQLITLGLSPHNSRAPSEDLETTVELLGLPITVLRLGDYFPKWTSNIYHGLTELRLGGSRGSISELALMTILISSPRLRVLEIKINITDDTQTHSPVTPVPLVDLELLIPGSCNSRGQIHLLRMTQPGPKPLTLSVEVPLVRAIVKSPGDAAMRRFFASSNITRLIIHEPRNYAEVTTLLALTPMVRVLALVRPFNPEIVEDESVIPPVSTVDALYVTDPLNTLPLLKQVIRRHGVRKLTLWGDSEIGAIVDQLSPICPQVTTLSREVPNPIQDWI